MSPAACLPRAALPSRGCRLSASAMSRRCRPCAFPISRGLSPPVGQRRCARLPEDRDALLAQAAETFHFGRFAEDPAIPPEVNRRRQVDWMEGLLAGRAEVLATGSPPEPGAFMAFTVTDGDADLVLGGTQPDRAVLALPFWTGVMLHLKERGIRRVDTVVSAANIGVANLYARLGFQLTGTLIGLHLHRS